MTNLVHLDQRRRQPPQDSSTRQAALEAEKLQAEVGTRFDEASEWDVPVTLPSSLTARLLGFLGGQSKVLHTLADHFEGARK